MPQCNQHDHKLLLEMEVMTSICHALRDVLGNLGASGTVFGNLISKAFAVWAREVVKD